jgi:hypothetical protein
MLSFSGPQRGQVPETPSTCKSFWSTNQMIDGGGTAWEFLCGLHIPAPSPVGGFHELQVYRRGGAPKLGLQRTGTYV